MLCCLSRLVGEFECHSGMNFAELGSGGGGSSKDRSMSLILEAQWEVLRARPENSCPGKKFKSQMRVVTGANLIKVFLFLSAFIC